MWIAFVYRGKKEDEKITISVLKKVKNYYFCIKKGKISPGGLSKLLPRGIFLQNLPARGQGLDHVRKVPGGLPVGGGGMLALEIH